LVKKAEEEERRKKDTPRIAAQAAADAARAAQMPTVADHGPAVDNRRPKRKGIPGVETPAQRLAREATERDAAAKIDDRLFDKEATRLAQQRARDLADGRPESDRTYSYYMMGSFEDGVARTTKAGQNHKQDELLARDVKDLGPDKLDDFSEKEFSKDTRPDPKNHAHLGPKTGGGWFAELRSHFKWPKL
jgi:hypothetical protein